MNSFQDLDTPKKKSGKKGKQSEKPAPASNAEPEILIVDELVEGSKAKPKKKKKSKKGEEQVL